LMPQKLTPEDWGNLAEAAKWSRVNADVLVDTHWIGGDPGKEEVYGWACWAPHKGIVTLRNPDDRTQEFALDVQDAFELPAGAPSKYVLKSPWAEDQQRPTLRAAAGASVAIHLRPFEILTLEATPTH